MSGIVAAILIPWRPVQRLATNSATAGGDHVVPQARCETSGKRCAVAGPKKRRRAPIIAHGQMGLTPLPQVDLRNETNVFD